jgi:hypothetical protein
VAVEVRPGIWTEMFKSLDAQAKGKGRELLTLIATALEKQAKINASAGAHAYGTPTPARRGSGPAVISGNLRRSLTHEPIRSLGPGHWNTRVGTGTGFYPSYGGHSRTPANKYGFYLEHGLRNGTTYPFLLPAFRHVTGTGADAIFRSIYGEKAWKRVF